MLYHANLKLAVLAAIASLLVLSGCVNTQRDSDESTLLTAIPSYGAAPLIRVKLDKPSQSDSVTINAGSATVSLDGRRTEASGELLVSQSAGKISVGELGTARSVEIAPTDTPDHFDIDGRIYRGRLRLIATAGGWEIVNVVDLEQYVAGVIGWEMIASWPVEALKAQAVASRTYAVFEMEAARASGRNWDVDDTTQYQVYGGVGPADKPNHWRETTGVLQAREATSGQVLTYNGKGFRAFFHSTSGGFTADPWTAFGLDESIPPLSGVDTGEFGKSSPKHAWSITLLHSEVKARLIEKGVLPSDIIRIENAETAPSGHAVTLKLFGRNGHHTKVSAISIRQALGLYSTRFAATKTGDEWTFEGSGYGHGCGMCQWSARGMAAAGWESGRILDTMYPGSKIKTIY